MPDFSVVIPLYNKERTVERAIRSVLNQNAQDFEIIVINDGSTDDGPDVVARLEDHRIRLIHQENRGVSAARNRGIAESQFDLIAFLDADDEWKPEFLETIRALAKEFPDASVFASAYVFSWDATQCRAQKLNGLPKGTSKNLLLDYFTVAAQSDPPICASAVTVRKDAIRHIGGFPAGVTSGEDLLVWAKLAIHYDIAFSKQPLAYFHLGDTVSPTQLRRIPDTNDIVGNELRRMLCCVPPQQLDSYRRYVALWNKMRASTLIRAGRRTAATRHSREAISLDPYNWKHYALLVFAILPGHIGRLVYGCTLNIRHMLSRFWK